MTYLTEEYFRESLFKKIKKQGIVDYVYWMIDSNKRLSVRLDKFLSKQLENPHEELIEVAMKLRSQSRGQDDLILRILKYVNQRVKYITDYNHFNNPEYWASAYETWKLKQDDCDGQNALIFILARLAGVSDTHLLNAIGIAGGVGHYWLVYRSFSELNWYTIDSTFYPDFSEMKNRKSFSINGRYEKIWYLFNDTTVMKVK